MTEEIRPESQTPEQQDAPRRVPAALWVVAIAVLVVAAVSAAFLMNRANAQRAASADLSEASRLAERADATVLAADEVVRSSIDATIGAKAASILEDVDSASDDLNSAIALINEAKEDLPSAEVAQAEVLKQAAEARLVMLEHAKVILGTTTKVAAGLEPADKGWEALQKAEELSDESVKQYNKLTKESVKKSKSLAVEAKEKAIEAKKLLGEAQSAYPSADMAAYVEYADAKIAALELSIKVDDAFLADKPKDANKLSDEFNAAEKKLLEQAKKLPESPRRVIGDAYEKEVAEASAAYSQARAEATDADERYRALMQL